jgi:hypothetical protein
MVTINTIQSLIAAYGDVILADDPIKALEKQGKIVSPALQKRLNDAANQKILSQTERQHWIQRLQALKAPGFSDQIRFKVGKSPQVVFKKLSSGDYDLIVGVRVAVIDETLAGLYDTRTWPARLPPDQAQQIFPLSSLRTFSDDIPDVDGLQIGMLHLTAAPTITAVTSGRLVLHQAFELDVDVKQPGLPRFTITNLHGAIHMQIPVIARRNPFDIAKLIVEFGTPSDQDLDDSHLEVNPASPVQPRDSESLAVLGAFVVDKLNLALIARTSLQPSISLCPNINVPLGSGFGLEVQRADARAVPSSDGDVVMVGVLAGTTSTPTEGAGEPSNLNFNPFATQASNVFVRVHEEFLNKVAGGALDYIQEKIQKKTGDLPVDIQVKALRVKLKTTNKIRFILDAKIVDVCGFVIQKKDLNFTATMTASVSVFNGEVKYETSGIDINYDNTDLAFCVLSASLELLIAVFTKNLFFGVFALFNILVLLGAGAAEIFLPEPDEGNFTGVFDPMENVPGTELLPRLEAVQVAVVEDSLQSFGLLTLRPDDLHTFIYLSLRRQLSFFSQPIADALVSVVDQDAPQPPNDDAVFKDESTTTINGNVTARVIFKFRARNETLAEGVTDKDGVVRLVIDRRTTAGTIIKTTLITEKGKEGTVRKIEESSLIEERPDIFFRITLPGESTVRDTRQSGQTPFFQLNLNSRRLGEPDAPLTLIFPGEFNENDGGVKE